MKQRSALVRLGATVTLATLIPSLLSACSSEGSTAAGDCGNTIKLGILTAFTGELGEFGKISKNAFDLAISDIEASGALPDGWKIETVVADEKGDIQTGLRAATDMMQKDKVSAILGPSSGPIIAMDSIAERYQIPIISQFAGTTNFNSIGGEYLFRTVASDSSDGVAVARYLTDKGAKNVVIIVQNDQSTVTAGSAAEDGLSDTGGTVKKIIKYNPGQPSYQAVVQQAIAEDADAIYLAGGQESATAILKEMRDLGVKSKTVTVSADLLVPETIKAVGPDWSDGLTGEIPKADTKRPQYVQLSDDYQAEFGEEAGPFAENAYDAVTLVALAAMAGDSTCGVSIAEQLPKVAADGKVVSNFADAANGLADDADIDYDGASGPLDFDKTGTVAGSYAVYEVSEGKWNVDKFYPAEEFTD